MAYAELARLIGAGLLASCTSSIAVSVVQVFVLLVGLILRGVSNVLRLNQILALNSRVHEYPFTFLGIVFGVTMCILV